MLNFLKTCFFTCTIWLLSALVNALLYGVIFSLGNIVRDNFSESAGLAFFFSLFFSTPAVFCLWIVFLANSEKENLSKILLKAVFILSLFSCVCIVFLPNEVYKGHWLLLSAIVVVSSIVSVMLHHPLLKSFHQPPSRSNV